LTSIPFLTKELADIYFERVKKKQDFSNLILTNIAELYNVLIEIKIRIQFEKANNNTKIEQLSKQFKKYFEDTKENSFQTISLI
jgi:hypothetical protein